MESIENNVSTKYSVDVSTKHSVGELPLPSKNENVSSLPVVNLIHGIVGVVILLVNIGLINCIGKWTRLKMATKMLFVNLATSDILFSVGSLLNFSRLFQHTGVTICSIATALKVVSRCVCSASIMFIAFDIFTTILFCNSSISNFFLTLPFIGTLLAITWLLSLPLAGVWIVGQISTNSCNLIAAFKMKISGVVAIVMVIQSLVSFLLYGLTYGIAAHRIRKLKASITPENLHETSLSVRRLQRNIKIAKLAIALGLLHLITHGPNLTVVTANGIFSASIPHNLFFISSIFLPINSLGNCLIYWWRSQEFRKIWRKMLSCKSTNSIEPN